MHAAGTGPIKTLVAIGFVVVIPLIAVFGIPERESVVASSGGDDAQRVRQHPVGVGESVHHQSDDLFADFPHDPAVRVGSDSAGDPLTVAVSSRDPFQVDPSTAATSGDPFLERTPAVPATALAGWSLQRPEESSPPVVGRFASRAAAGPGEDDLRTASNVKPAVPADGKAAAALPGNTTTAQTASGGRASRSRSGPKPVRHHDSQPTGQPSATPKAAPGAKSPVPQTWRAAVRRLNELGIHQFRLEPGGRPNEFHFHCSFTPSDTPRLTHRFEAEATEPLRAVQKVIAQVEQWLQRR